MAANYAQCVTPYAGCTPASDLEDLAPGSGCIVQRCAGKLVVYREEGSGELHACSAVCPHMLGVVRWNPLEARGTAPSTGPCSTRMGAACTGHPRLTSPVQSYRAAAAVAGPAAAALLLRGWRRGATGLPEERGRDGYHWVQGMQG